MVLFAGPVSVGPEIMALTQAAAFALAEDSVEQLAVRTRRATAASVDFDDLADGVYRTTTSVFIRSSSGQQAQ